jgi:hypothetical protein
VPEKRRERLVNAPGRLRGQAPPQRRRHGDDDDHRYEHAAHPVAELLDFGAAVLRALNHGDDLRQRGGIARGGDAHDEAAVEVHGAAIDFRAGLLVHGDRLAGEHRFIHGGGAFDDFAVGWNAVAGTERDAVIEFELRHGHFVFVALRVQVAGRLRGEVQQRPQGTRGPGAHARFEPVADADERDDRRGLHEIEVAGPTREQAPCAERERRRRAERHECVHVRAEVLRLVPRAAIEPRAAEDLHRQRERERGPVEPPLHAQAEDPFAEHQQAGDEGTEDDVEPPAVEGGGRMLEVRGGRRRLRGFVAGGLHRGDHGRLVALGVRLPANRGAAGFETHTGAGDAGHGLNRLRDMPRAVLAGHAGDPEFRDGGPGL